MKQLLASLSATVLLCCLWSAPASAQSGCLTYLPYTGVDLFNCKIDPSLPDCPQCSYCCRLFVLRNDCDCCIDAIDFAPQNDSCWGVCGVLDDPSHNEWTGPSLCQKRKFFITPTDSNCLQPGQSLVVRMCSSGPLTGVKMNYGVWCGDKLIPGDFTFPSVFPDCE